MNRAERRQAERADQRATTSNMEKLRTNAERLRNNAAGGAGEVGVGDYEGIPMGTNFNLGNGQILPPFSPTHQCNLIRLEVNGTSFFVFNLAGPYGGGLYYMTVKQFQQLVENGIKELEIAKAAQTGITIVGSEAEMHAVAERAEKMSSGLIVPGR